MSELEILDARGLLCPLPVIRTQDRIRQLPAGSLLEVLASDAGALHDIPAWCRIHGHTLEEVVTVEDSTGGTHLGGKAYRFRIRTH